MQLTDTNTGFGMVTKTIHWLTVLLVFLLFVLGVLMTKMLGNGSWEVEEIFFAFSLHKTLGMTVLALAVVRVLWRLTQLHPHPFASHQKLEITAAKTVHWLLYALIFLMPITGWLHHSATVGLSPIWGPFPQKLWFVPQVEDLEKFLGWTHYATAWLMGAIIAIHIAGALKHAIIDRDDTLRRMLPGKPSRHNTQKELTSYVPMGLASGVLVSLLVVIFLFRPDHAPEAQLREAVTSDRYGDWAVNYENSVLEIEVVQNGTSTTGVFSDWSAEIFYDPASPETAEVSVNISIPSLTLGSVTSQALSSDFLNASTFPDAVFHVEGFKLREDGLLDADGTFELSDVSTYGSN